MRILFVLSLLFTTLIGLPIFADDPTPTDPPSVWKISIFHDQTSGNDKHIGGELFFIQGRMIIHIKSDDAASATCKYELKKLDGKNIIELEVIKKGEQKILKGLYKVEKATLEICWGKEGLPEEISPREGRLYIKAKRTRE